MTFKDRKEAGKRLAEKLKGFKNAEAIIYALPRGGVIVGNEIAKALNLPLDLVISRKIGHQFNPEYAICAIAENGHSVCNEKEEMEANPEWLKERFKEERKEAARRRKVYLKNRPSISPKNKIAIIVDDGIATGLTIRAAIKEIKNQNPSKIILAIPVAPFDTIARIKSTVDEVVALEIDDNFSGAVGEYYKNFSQVEDNEVIKIMENYDK